MILSAALIFQFSKRSPETQQGKPTFFAEIPRIFLFFFSLAQKLLV